jgi:hypothetical protein
MPDTLSSAERDELQHLEQRRREYADGIYRMDKMIQAFWRRHQLHTEWTSQTYGTAERTIQNKQRD